MPPARVLERQVVLRGRVFEVAVERVQLPNHVEARLEIVRHPGAAAVVPLTARGEILMVRQFRHAADGYLWEIPAGTLAAGEEAAACARRELEEEAGMRAGALVELGEVVPVPGYSTERIHLFLARDLAPVAQSLDEDELIAEVRAVPVRQALRWAVDGELTDAKSVIGLYRARDRGLLPGLPPFEGTR